MNIRQVELADLPVVAEMMHYALEPYYGGDHRAHARRIVETAASGSIDSKGHFSAAQIMFVAEDEDAQVVGVMNFVVKHQGTLKISPLIVSEGARGQGVSARLLSKIDAYIDGCEVRQVYCTVSAKNRIALSYFKKRGFVRAGMAKGHYRTLTDEIMLYRDVERSVGMTEEKAISVVPLESCDEDQVRKMVLRRLSPFFDGVDDGWVDALFAGYSRRTSNDPNEKYKLIWVAKSSDNEVLGVAAATPKKGEPIKMMPLIADCDQAFSALIAEMPCFLGQYGHKLYTHCVPHTIEVGAMQLHGWTIEAIMPNSYKQDVTTQQWGLQLEGENMKMMRVKKQYFDAIMAGTKPLEVRVGYNSIKKIAQGDNLLLQSGRSSGKVNVTSVRKYDSFATMLAKEDARQIIPNDPRNALKLLQGIYPPEKENLGVYVFELKVVQ